MSTLLKKLNLLRPDNLIRYHQRNVRAQRLSARYRIGKNSGRIYHYHIRKTGGTSLNHIFLSLGDAKTEPLYRSLVQSFDNRLFKNKKVFVGWSRKLIEKGHYFYAFSHTPMHKLRLPKDTFTITILRNPVDRVISHYNMLLEYIGGTEKHPTLQKEKEWFRNDFTEFLRRIPKKHLFRQLYMFSRSFDVDEAFENIIGLSHFFFTENFPKGISVLSKKLNMELKAVHIRKTRKRARLSRKELGVLRDILEPEISLYKRLKNYQSRHSS